MRWCRRAIELSARVEQAVRAKLDDVGARALRRGLQEMAKDTIAEHNRTGKPVPQRLALMARGEGLDGGSLPLTRPDPR